MIVVGKLGIVGCAELVCRRHGALHDFIDLHLLEPSLASDSTLLTESSSNTCRFKGHLIVAPPRLHNAATDKSCVGRISEGLAERDGGIKHGCDFLFLDIRGP